MNSRVEAGNPDGCGGRYRYRILEPSDLCMVRSLKLKWPLKIGRPPKRKPHRFPTIHFSGLVSGKVILYLPIHVVDFFMTKNAGKYIMNAFFQGRTGIQVLVGNGRTWP